MTNDFNVDLIHDEKMEKIDMLINSHIVKITGRVKLEDESELKGYIKALDWVMEKMEE